MTPTQQAISGRILSDIDADSFPVSYTYFTNLVLSNFSVFSLKSLRDANSEKPFPRRVKLFLLYY